METVSLLSLDHFVASFVVGLGAAGTAIATEASWKQVAAQFLIAFAGSFVGSQIISRRQANATNDVALSTPPSVPRTGGFLRILPIVVLCSLGFGLQSCQSALPQQLIVYNNTMRSAADAAFQVADELASAETDPAKAAKLHEKIAKIRQVYMLASAGFNAVLASIPPPTTQAPPSTLPSP